MRIACFQFTTFESSFSYPVLKILICQESGDLNAFPDAGKVSGFAKEAMTWANGAGIITGDSGMLNPQGKVNRAVGATMISRFGALVGGSQHVHSWEANYKDVVVKEAWDETVTVKEAWSEEVLVKEEQTITISYDLCKCGAKLYSKEEIQQHALLAVTNPAAVNCGSRNCKTETKIIPAEYKTVNHPAETKVVNHPAETRQELVSHTCTKCGVVK